MKALFIGGTGIISTSVSRCTVENGWDLTLLNRGNRPDDVPGARQLILDISDEQAAAKALENQHFDVVVDFIAFDSAQIERDIRLFTGKTDQYMFISSASVYQKPLPSPVISEATSLSNPYWEYARKKIACEETLMKAFRNDGFPVTIIRPSHTFANRSIPVPVHGKNGAWQVLKRMMNGKRIIVPGDGNTLWAVMSSADFARAFVGLMAISTPLARPCRSHRKNCSPGIKFCRRKPKPWAWNSSPAMCPRPCLLPAKAMILGARFLGTRPIP